MGYQKLLNPCKEREYAMSLDWNILHSLPDWNILHCAPDQNILHSSPDWNILHCALDQNILQYVWDQNILHNSVDLNILYYSPDLNILHYSPDSLRSRPEPERYLEIEDGNLPQGLNPLYTAVRWVERERERCRWYLHKQITLTNPHQFSSVWRQAMTTQTFSILFPFLSLQTSTVSWSQGGFSAQVPPK